MKGYDDEWMSKYYLNDPVFVKCFRYCADRDAKENESLQKAQKEQREQKQQDKINLTVAMCAKVNQRQGLGSN